MFNPIKPYTGGALVPPNIEPESNYNAGALEDASRKQQKDIVSVKKPIKDDYLYAQISQQNIVKPTSSLEIQQTAELQQVDEATFNEILSEMKAILAREVELFGQALEKSILESLHKKLQTLESRLIKKMIIDIFTPAESSSSDTDSGSDAE